MDIFKKAIYRCGVLVVLLLSIPVTSVFAGEPGKALSSNSLEALALFKQGESAFNLHQFDVAKELYLQAVALQAQDGDIVTRRELVSSSVAYGRLVKRVQEEKLQKESYFPNRRIEEISEIFLEQTRRMNPPVLRLKWLTLREPTRDNILDGGEQGSMVLNVENQGRSPALGVSLSVQSQNDTLVYDRVLHVGKLEPGQISTVQVELGAPRNVEEKAHRFLFKALEKSGFDSNEVQVYLHTKPHQPARIHFTDIKVTDFNNDNRIETMEPVVVDVAVSNIGAGVSNELKAQWQLGENVFLVPGSQSGFDIGLLHPGETKKFGFSFLTNKRLQHKQRIPVSIQISEAGAPQPKSLLSQSLQLQVYAPEDTVSVDVRPQQRSVENAVTSDSNAIDIAASIPAGRKANPDAVAVVIGNKNYSRKNLPAVKYAHNDARMMQRYLVRTLGFREENIIYIEDATSALFQETFGSANNFAGKLYNYVKQGKSDVFIYYSGHGAPDLTSKDAFFVPVDVDPAYIATSGYSLELFYKNISQIPAKSITVVLDTCFSGKSDGGYLLQNVSPARVLVKTHLPLIESAVIFASSQAEQVSTWYHQKKHGLFTYYFLKGLGGAADLNGDLKLTSTEMGDFLKKTVPYQARKLSGQDQQPTLYQQQEVLITHLKPVEHGHGRL